MGPGLISVASCADRSRLPLRRCTGTRLERRLTGTWATDVTGVSSQPKCEQERCLTATCPWAPCALTEAEARALPGAPPLGVRGASHLPFNYAWRLSF